MKIIVDSRERKPFIFYNKFGDQIEYQIKKLDTGDYSIEGYEHLLCIERKESTTELAGNCISKRFVRELERMQKYKYAYVILEFSFDDILGYPQNLKLPPWIKRKIKVSGNFILTRMCQWSLDYDFQILACGNRQKAQDITLMILNKVMELEQEKNNNHVRKLRAKRPKQANQPKKRRAKNKTV